MLEIDVIEPTIGPNQSVSFCTILWIFNFEILCVYVTLFVSNDCPFVKWK